MKISSNIFNINDNEIYNLCKIIKNFIENNLKIMLNQTKPSIAVFADGVVGEELIKWLVEYHHKDVVLVVTTSKNNIYKFCIDKSLSSHKYIDENKLINEIKEKNIKIDIGILLWWPKIISSKIINSAKKGFINTHPSLLPNNRGKHFSFWALVENCPFGVTIHMVGDGIDDGAIISQSKIEYTWEDNGETLYKSAQKEMIKLFKKTYPMIRSLEFPTKPQDLDAGSFHYSKEIEQSSLLQLDQTIKVRELLNLLRARTFEGHPACRFEEDGIEYEVRVEITKKK